MTCLICFHARHFLAFFLGSFESSKMDAKDIGWIRPKLKIWACVNLTLNIGLLINLNLAIFTLDESYYYIPIFIAGGIFILLNLTGEIFCIFGLYKNNFCCIFTWQILFVITIVLLIIGQIILGIFLIYSVGISVGIIYVVIGMCFVSFWIWHFFVNRLIWTMTYKTLMKGI